MKMKLYRWRKKLLMTAALLPLCQTTGTCDLNAIPELIGQQLVNATFNVIVGSVNQTLLTSFPSSDVIQILLGGNRQPFIQQ